MDFIGNIKKLAEKALSQKDLLDTDSKRTKRYLISTDPKHSDGEPFTAPEEIEFLYIETHANSSMIIKYARRIIEHVEQDPARFKVR